MRVMPIVFVIALGAVACASSEEPPVVTESASLADRLAGGQKVWFNPYESTARVDVRSGGGEKGVVQEDVILIKRGTAKLMRDAAGDPALYSFEVELQDTPVGAGPFPIRLTNIAFTLVNHVDGPGCWNMEATDVEARTTMALDFAWSVAASDDTTRVLTTERLRDVPVVVTAFVEDGDLRAHVSVARPGVFWTGPHGVELGNLRMELEAVDEVYEPIP